MVTRLDAQWHPSKPSIESNKQSNSIRIQGEQGNSSVNLDSYSSAKAGETQDKIERIKPLTPEEVRANLLVDALPKIDDDIRERLTPTCNKVPCRPNWTKEPYLGDEKIIELLRCGEWRVSESGRRFKQEYNGYAVRLGSGLVACDFDGKSALALGQAIAQGNGGMPDTVSWKGARGRSALYWLPSDLVQAIESLPTPIGKIKITKHGESFSIKGEAIELLYEGRAATIPPSHHPKLDNGYQWLLDFQSADFGIDQAPQWVAGYFWAEVERRKLYLNRPVETSNLSLTPEIAQQVLERVDPDDYDIWFKVGCALKSALGEDGLDAWEGWSQLSSKYRHGDCDRRWDGIEEGRIPAEYLYRVAALPVPSRLETQLLRVVQKGGDAGTKAESTKAKGFADKETAIRKRRMRFNQYREYLKNDFTLSDRAIDITYEGFAPKFNLLAQTVCLTGWLGAGKTQAGILAALEEAKCRPLLWLSGRRGLLRQSENRINLLKSIANAADVPVYYYQDDVTLYKSMIRNGEPGIYLITDAALKNHTDENIRWENTTLVVDEFSQIRCEIVKKREQFKNFQKALVEARKVLAIDAFFSDTDYAILRRYRSMEPGAAQIYRQKFEKSKKRIIWLEALTKEKEQTISFNHEGLYFPLLRGWFEEGIRKFAIAIDSKTGAKVLRNFLEGLGLKVKLVCYDTPDESLPFMASPDEDWAVGDYDVLIYTSTAQSGLDVQIPFERGLLISTGILSPLQMLQMLGRCRQCPEWYVSAPRMSIDPGVSASKVSTSTLKKWTEKSQSAWEALKQPYTAASTAWELHQAITRDLEQSFNSEYLFRLLEVFFENISTEVIENPEVADYRKEIQRVKRDEAVATMKADLERGIDLRSQEKSPASNADVWNINLAKAIEKIPSLEKIAERFKAAQIDEDSDDSLDELAATWLMLTHNRIDKIKNWVMVQNSEALNELYEQQSLDPLAYNSGLARTYRNMRLFKELELQQLACFTKEATAHQNHFLATSPVIHDLWLKFTQSDWGDCFPMVETLFDFWAIVKKSMKFMGFQSSGKRMRVETEELHPNGFDRNGNQRFTNSKSMYFVGWLPMEVSGNSRFQAAFPEIIECIKDMVFRERERRQQYIDKRRGEGTIEDCPGSQKKSPHLKLANEFIRLHTSAPGLPPPGDYRVLETRSDGVVLIDAPALVRWISPKFFDRLEKQSA